MSYKIIEKIILLVCLSTTGILSIRLALLAPDLLIDGKGWTWRKAVIAMNAVLLGVAGVVTVWVGLRGVVGR